jgi:hypothetical protein
MPLTESELAALTAAIDKGLDEKLELAVMRGFERHRREDHEPMKAALVDVQKDIIRIQEGGKRLRWMERGVWGSVLGVVELIMRVTGHK